MEATLGLGQRFRMARSAIHLAISDLADMLCLDDKELDDYEENLAEPEEPAVAQMVQARATGESPNFLQLEEAATSEPANLYDGRMAQQLTNSGGLEAKVAYLENRCKELEAELARRKAPVDELEKSRLLGIASKAAAHGGIDHLIGYDVANMEGRIIFLPKGLNRKQLEAAAAMYGGERTCSPEMQRNEIFRAGAAFILRRMLGVESAR